MHSQYLNEDKICEMFQDDGEEQPRKQEVSLNFTVTSRESRSLMPGGTGAHPQHTYNPTPNHFHIIDVSASGPCLSEANKELKKFNKWMQSFNKQNEKIIDDLSTLTSFAQVNKADMLDLPDLNCIRKACTRSLKNNNGMKLGEMVKNSFCGECLKKEELIEIIQEQYGVKLEECGLKEQRIRALEDQITTEIQQNMRVKLLNGAQVNILTEQNQNLLGQIVNLKAQIQKSRLEKSLLMQKSTSLLKTKDILDKKSESTSSKLFSNAKFSTNVLNPNDTLNRVDSIMCFGDTEPNIDELIRYYDEEAHLMKSKAKEQTAIEADKKQERKYLSRESKVLFINEQNRRRLADIYSEIKAKLVEVKTFKEKYPTLFTTSMKSRRIEEDEMAASNQGQVENYKKVVADLEKKVRCIENEKNNLAETNSELIRVFKEYTLRIKELEDRLKEADNRHRVEIKYISEKYTRLHMEKKALMFEIEETKGPYRVYCRVRPKMGAELKNRSKISYGEDNRIIKDGKQYEFSYVFNDRSTQQQIFKHVKGLVDCVIEGKSLTVFAYGQPGSGKTYTIHGSESQPGLALQIISYLYDMEWDRKNNDVSFLISYLEVYKDEIKDLMGITGKVELRQDPDKGVYLSEHKPIRVQTKSQLEQIYFQSRARRCGQGDNSHSSRSHCVFTICIEMRHKSKNEIRSSKITLIDLAGAERVTSNPLTAKQAHSINRSLTSFVSVFNALRNREQMIPYKENKLTLLLREAMSPRNNIVGFVNISPSELCSLETSNSLAMFGGRPRALDRSPMLKSKDYRENKENEKNRRSSTRVSIS